MKRSISAIKAVSKTKWWFCDKWECMVINRGESKIKFFVIATLSWFLFMNFKYKDYRKQGCNDGV